MQSTLKSVARLLILGALVSPLTAYALFEQCLDFFPKQVIPSTTEQGRDLCFDDFAIYYSPRDKKPIYTVEHLHPGDLLGKHPRRGNQFYEEARLPANERALLSDYRGSGYDRGHNVPAGDMFTANGMAQSFSLANMMPQAPRNNQGIWAKNVEEPTRQYAKRSGHELFIFTGSVGNQGSIGRSHITIPSSLFKLIYDPAKNRAWAYWVDNTNDAPMMPPISYSELLEKTHIDFHLPLNQEPENSQSPHKVGGWYPVFFDRDSPEKLQAILSRAQTGHVRQIEIKYDRNTELAQQLAKQLGAAANIPITLIQATPPNFSAIQYDRNRVSVLVHLQ